MRRSAASASSRHVPVVVVEKCGKSGSSTRRPAPQSFKFLSAASMEGSARRRPTSTRTASTFAQPPPQSASRFRSRRKPSACVSVHMSCGEPPPMERYLSTDEGPFTCAMPKASACLKGVGTPTSTAGFEKRRYRNGFTSRSVQGPPQVKSAIPVFIFSLDRAAELMRVVGLAREACVEGHADVAKESFAVLGYLAAVLPQAHEAVEPRLDQLLGDRVEVGHVSLGRRPVGLEPRHQIQNVAAQYQVFIVEHVAAEDGNLARFDARGVLLNHLLVLRKGRPRVDRKSTRLHSS